MGVVELETECAVWTEKCVELEAHVKTRVVEAETERDVWKDRFEIEKRKYGDLFEKTRGLAGVVGKLKSRLMNHEKDLENGEERTCGICMEGVPDVAIVP